MNMPVKEAVRIASRWVNVEVLGERRFRVNYWDDNRRVWLEGQEMTQRVNALGTAWECKVRITLELLGVKDAEGLAHAMRVKNRPRDWRHSVREAIRIADARKIAASNRERMFG